MTEANVIIGGGVAGATAALALARAGRDVDLYERSSSASDKICGEFLSREVSANLRALGVDPVDFGARPITRVRLVRGAHSVDEPLPFPALALSRKTLDEALLERVAASGANVIRGKTARSIERSDDGGFVVSFGGEDYAAARTIFLATGKHDLRGAKRVATGRQSDYLALKMHFRFDRRKTEHLRSVVELILLKECYLGVMLVEDDHVNFCPTISERRFNDAGRAGMVCSSNSAGSRTMSPTICRARNRCSIARSRSAAFPMALSTTRPQAMRRIFGGSAIRSR